MTSAAVDAQARATRLKGILSMCAAGLCFVLLDVLAKTLARDYAVPQVVWARYVFHTVLMVVFLAPRHGMALLATARKGLQIGRSLFLLGATFFFFSALKYIPLADATTIAFINPLIVVALSAPLLGERVGARRWFAVLAGFTGVLIVLRPGLGVMHWASVFPLVMALCYALYQLTTRMLSGTENPYTTLFYTALVGTVGTSIALPFFWTAPTPAAWVMMAGMGLLGGIGHLFLIRAFGLAPASVLSPFGYVQLIWVTLAGYLFFGDFPDRWTIVGALVIAGSGLYTIYGERKNPG